MDVMELLTPLNMEEMDYDKQLVFPVAMLTHDELTRRQIWVGEIDKNTIDEVSRWIMRFNKEDVGIPVEERKPIKLFIYSYGGDLDAACQIIATIQCSKTPVYGYCLGQACSAAFFILVACHKRFALPMSTIMAHQGSAGIEGTYNIVTTATEQYRNQMKALGEFTVAHTKIPKATYNKKIKTEWYVTIDDALRYGIIDEIISDLEEVVT